MKGAVIKKFGASSDVIDIKRNLPIPDVLPDQVLIKVFTVAVNPIDVSLKEDRVHSTLKPPYIPGGDVSGIVHKCGSDVRKFMRGQRVFAVMSSPLVTGGCADYTVVHQDHVFQLHDNLSSSHGAAVGLPYFTAYKALFMVGEAKPGEILLIHHSNTAIGIAACQLAKAFGLITLCTANSIEDEDLFKDTGADAVFNSQKSNQEQIKKYCDGKEVNIILEFDAASSLSDDLDIVGQRGRIVVLDGNQSTVDWNKVIAKEILLRGVNVFKSSKAEFAEISAAVCRGIELGYVKPVIASEYPLTEVDKAHAHVKSSKHMAGTVIISL